MGADIFIGLRFPPAVSAEGKDHSGAEAREILSLAQKRSMVITLKSDSDLVAHPADHAETGADRKE